MWGVGFAPSRASADVYNGATWHGVARVPRVLLPLVHAMTRATASEPISLEEIRLLARGRFGDVVKAVVDLRRGIMLLDADMHADEEAELLAEGAAQADLWGINLYPDVEGEDWLEFDSMINLRPSFGNRSRGVDDPATREAIAELVEGLVRR